jgi:hypothetical protein
MHSNNSQHFLALFPVIQGASQLRRLPIQVKFRYVTQTGCMLVRRCCCVGYALPLLELRIDRQDSRPMKCFAGRHAGSAAEGSESICVV